MKTSDIAVVSSPLFLRHDAGEPHAERPERLLPIHELLETDPGLKILPRIPLIEASSSTLERVHSLEHVREVLSLKGKAGWLDPDTYYCPETIDVALSATGATTDLALRVWRGEYRRAFSLIRPPGHHATPTRAMGFCLFNSVAVAAAAIQAEKPGVKLAIVDFDLHHGNGTQDFFYEDPSVLFISSHRFPFYPGTGALEEIGKGKGKGTTVNFPISRRLGRELFLPLYSEIVLPQLKAFQPDMILVSAGFDGHAMDPMEGFRLSEQDFGDLARVLIAAAEETMGKILFVLEGGYDPVSLAASVKEVFGAMESVSRTKSPSLPLVTDTTPEFDRIRAFYRPLFPEIG